MTHLFAFEADFVESLRCIPMEVRYKLDTCGIKLRLADWNHMSFPERQTLTELPCDTQTEIQYYRNYLQDLILKYTSIPATELPIDTHPAWMQPDIIPISVQEKAQEFGVFITAQQWSQLTPLQRFALIKLSRSGHENKNFSSAMIEFNLC